MCKFKELGVSWPPAGWDKLAFIKTTNGQAIAKDLTSAKVVGLSYSIEPLPIYQENTGRGTLYALQIDGWEYNIHNESREYPVLSLMLRERNKHNISRNNYISDIRTNAQLIRRTPRSTHRSLMAALFIIKQIKNNQVPDTDRILRLYKIHPSQRDLYSGEHEKGAPKIYGTPDKNLMWSDAKA